MEAPTFDYMLRQGAVLGLAFVFLAGVLGILLWVAIVIVRIANKYALNWFETSIDTMRHVDSNVKKMAKAIMVMYRNNKTTNDALHHTMVAFIEFLESPQATPTGLSSKSLSSLRLARLILERRERYEAEIREREEREDTELAKQQGQPKPSDSDKWDSLEEI